MNHHSLLLTCLLAALILSGGCGEDTTTKDDLAPQPPIPIIRSDFSAYPQQGIRPEPVSDYREYKVRIEWERNSETDIKGYYVQRGSINPEDGPTYYVGQLEYGFELSSDPSVTEHFWIDTGKDYLGQSTNMLSPVLGEPRSYFWQIAAYDEAGNLSAWSDTVRYTLISNPSDFEVIRYGEDDYRLNWLYPTGEFLKYKVRVYSSHNGFDDVIWDPPLYYRYTSQQSITFNDDSTAQPLVSDCTYVWQLNAIRDDETGSAIFTTFKYQD